MPDSLTALSPQTLEAQVVHGRLGRCGEEGATRKTREWKEGRAATLLGLRPRGIVGADVVRIRQGVFSQQNGSDTAKRRLDTVNIL